MKRKAARLGVNGIMPPEPLHPALRPASSVAIAALLIAVFSVLCPPAGIVAIVAGILAHRDVRRSAGSRHGHGLANAAIGLGTASTALGVAMIVWLSPPEHVALTENVRATGPSSLSPPSHDNPLLETGARDLFAQGPPPVVETQVGAILLIDLGPTIGSLSAELEKQHRLAREADNLLLLWLVVPDCAPCRAVAEALRDSRMQRALSNVRLVRLNVRDFVVELSHINIPLDAFPGFAFINGDGRAIDYVHGGEWDEDVPENIAPVLESFVGGTYENRRHPWRGGPHEDETPI